MHVHACRACTCTLRLTGPYKLTLTTPHCTGLAFLSSLACTHSLTALPQAYRLRLRRRSVSRALLPSSQGHPYRPLLTFADGPTLAAFVADGNDSTATVRERVAAPAVTVAGLYAPPEAARERCA